MVYSLLCYVRTSILRYYTCMWEYDFHTCKSVKPFYYYGHVWTQVIERHVMILMT